MEIESLQLFLCRYFPHLWYAIHLTLLCSVDQQQALWFGGYFVLESFLKNSIYPGLLAYLVLLFLLLVHFSKTLQARIEIITIFWKTTTSYSLKHTHTCAFQGVRNAIFLENYRKLIRLERPFNSSKSLILPTNDLIYLFCKSKIYNNH